jgi:coenzyme F420 hydrogenase subunit beta
VGTVEGEEGWNTVIVRTARGEDLLRLAESKGVLETRAYPEDKWVHLKWASILKKQRGLNALKDVQEKYVTLPQKVIDAILKEVAP